MHFFTDSRFDQEVRPALSVHARAAEAQRWLSEFDDILGTFWDYLLKGSWGIDYCRNAVRAAIKERENAVVGEVEELRKQLEATTLALRDLRYAQDKADGVLMGSDVHLRELTQLRAENEELRSRGHRGYCCGCDEEIKFGEFYELMNDGRLRHYNHLRRAGCIPDEYKKVKQ